MRELLTTMLKLRPEGWLSLIAIMLPLTVVFAAALVKAASGRRQERTFIKLVRERLAPALDAEDAPESDEMAEDALVIAKTFLMQGGTSGSPPTKWSCRPLSMGAGKSGRSTCIRRSGTSRSADRADKRALPAVLELARRWWPYTEQRISSVHIRRVCCSPRSAARSRPVSRRSSPCWCRTNGSARRSP
ncbi:hypothetical protein SAMN00790413_04468 [Deinococcus hopiensis KR-140]|uniref:Uncharacterized protein n=1 Tax=Deinococcus hopiensis KR-140 TaxID=695939 RepID=A0A1W1UJC1_9DEIO|nr:hypothetical protein SAMN00790413_04468 [Deinococcus hopiensis KR-140]